MKQQLLISVERVFFLDFKFGVQCIHKFVSLLLRIGILCSKQYFSEIVGYLPKQPNEQIKQRTYDGTNTK
jgi:hypothetical protein